MKLKAAFRGMHNPECGLPGLKGAATKRGIRFFGVLFAGILWIWGACYADSSAQKDKVSEPTAISEQVSSTWQWPVSTPDDQGLDPKRLAELADLIRKGELCPQLHCLLVIRHGYIIVEEYFNGWRADGLHTLQYVTKSFTSALVGIAIARGEFKSVPEHDMVVVINAMIHSVSEQNKPTEIFYNRILTAVRR